MSMIEKHKYYDFKPVFTGQQTQNASSKPSQVNWNNKTFKPGLLRAVQQYSSARTNADCYECEMKWVMLQDYVYENLLSMEISDLGS